MQQFNLNPKSSSRRTSIDFENALKVAQKLQKNPIKFHGAEPKITYGKMVSK